MAIDLVSFTPEPSPEDGPFYINPAHVVSVILANYDDPTVVITLTDGRNCRVAESLPEVLHLLRTGRDFDPMLQKAWDLYQYGPSQETEDVWPRQPAWLKGLLGKAKATAGE